MFKEYLNIILKFYFYIYSSIVVISVVITRLKKNNNKNALQSYSRASKQNIILFLETENNP